MADLPKLTSITLAEFNADMRAFSRKIADAARAEGQARSVGSSESATGQGMQSIKPFTKKRDGEIEHIGIKFQRQLIFVEHGVGRGRSVDDAPGEKASRRPRPFLSTGVDKHSEEIADAAAKYHADDWVRRVDRELELIDRGSTSIRITKS